MQKTFSQAEMALRDTLLMKSDGKAFDDLAVEYEFPRPEWIRIEHWRRALQCVLYAPRGTMHTLRAFLHNALMAWTVPFTWTAAPAEQLWMEMADGTVMYNAASQNFFTESDYQVPGVPGPFPTYALHPWDSIDTSSREIWLRKTEDSRPSGFFTQAAKLDGSGNVVVPAKKIPQGAWITSPATVDENGDWIDQTFMGYPEHPWKFHLIENSYKSNQVVQCYGADTGYHTGVLRTPSDYNPYDAFAASSLARYTVFDKGEGFLSPYVVTERSPGHHSKSIDLAMKEASHIRIHLFLHQVPLPGVDGATGRMGTYLISGEPSLYASVAGAYGDPVETLVTKKMVDDDPEFPYPAGGKRTSAGQPFGGHMQISAASGGDPLGVGAHPPYLTNSNAKGAGGLTNVDALANQDPFDIALGKLMPTGVTYEFIKGWGDGLPDSYMNSGSAGHSSTSYRRFLWPVGEINGKKFPGSPTDLQLVDVPDAIDWGE